MVFWPPTPKELRRREDRAPSPSAEALLRRELPSAEALPRREARSAEALLRREVLEALGLLTRLQTVLGQWMGGPMPPTLDRDHKVSSMIEVHPSSAIPALRGLEEQVIQAAFRREVALAWSGIRHRKGSHPRDKNTAAIHLALEIHLGLHLDRQRLRHRVPT
jgi:hypothetical protein